MQRSGAKFSSNNTSSVEKTNEYPEEFAKKRPPLKQNPFAALLPRDVDNLLARPLRRNSLNVDRALGGWIRHLDSRIQETPFSEANEFLRDKYKLKFSCDDIRTRLISPKNNLFLLKEAQLYAGTSNNDSYANSTDEIKTGLCFPRNKIEIPISKFLLKDRYRTDVDADEREYRRKNTHPPAELVQVYRGRYDQEANFFKAFKEWVDILAKKPSVPKPSKAYKQRKRAKLRRWESAEKENSAAHPEAFSPERRAGKIDGRFVTEGCCCRRNPFMPRHQISPPRGAVLSSTNYHDQYGEKCGFQREPILPIDGMSPPHGAVRSDTNYNDQFYEKGVNRRGYIIPPDGMSPPHGKVLSGTNYAFEFPEKPYSKRELLLQPGCISPPHGVVSSATNYADEFPEKDICRRGLIILPGGISPPHGMIESDTNYAREFQEFGNCQRSYIVPPENMSPPRGQMPSDTIYNDQYQEKGHFKREPIYIPNAISPPKGCMQEQTTYLESYKECEQCARKPYFPTEEVSPPRGKMPSDTTYTVNFKECGLCQRFPTAEEMNLTEKEASLDPDQDYQEELVAATPEIQEVLVGSGKNELWRVEEELENDISNLAFTKMVLDKRLQLAKRQQISRRKKSKKRKIKVVQKMESQNESHRLMEFTSPPSPKPPTRIKQIFATSYNKSYTAPAMRNLN